MILTLGNAEGGSEIQGEEIAEDDKDKEKIGPDFVSKSIQ